MPRIMAVATDSLSCGAQRADQNYDGNQRSDGKENIGMFGENDFGGAFGVGSGRFGSRGIGRFVVTVIPAMAIAESAIEIGANLAMKFVTSMPEILATKTLWKTTEFKSAGVMEPTMTAAAAAGLRQPDSPECSDPRRWAARKVGSRAALLQHIDRN